MKVILKGINYTQGESEDCVDESFYFELLKQVPYPVEVKVDDKFPHVVNLKQWIKDTESSEEWGLLWFNYEKVKD